MAKKPREKRMLSPYRQITAETRRAKNEREQREHDRVQTLIESALARPRRSKEFDLDQALEELDDTRALAMAVQQPGAAAKCTMYKAQLVGLVVEQHAVGKPEDFLRGTVEEGRRTILERMAERVGARRAQRLLAAFDSVMKEDEDDGNADLDVER